MSTNTDVILIKYQSDMSDLKKDLVALTASNKKIEAELKNIGAAGKKAGAEASEGFKKVGVVTKGLEGTFNSLKSQIAGVFAVQQIQQFVKESVKAAAAAEGIERAFNRIAPEGTLNKLREATKGTVADVQLMTATVKASNFGIPVENLGKLFEFAQQRAQQTGENVDYLVDSIVLGISRKSIPILDNLGLSATRVREEFNKLGGAEITVANAAKAVGDIATEELDRMGAATLTTADKFQQYTSMWQNFKVLVGQATILTGAFFEGMVKNAAKGDTFLEKAKNFLSNANPVLFLINNLKAGEKAVEDIAKAEEQAADSNVAYFNSMKRLNDISSERLEAMLKQRTEAIKNNQVTQDGIGTIQGEIRAISELLKKRNEVTLIAQQELEYQKKSASELQALSEKGDELASKELKRRENNKKAHDDQVKREEENLNKSLKNLEAYYTGVENKAKERFTNNEISEEELNEALQNIESARLTNTLSFLQRQKVSTKEVQDEIKDLTFKTETEIADFEVDQTKERAAEQERIQEELEKAEKERLDNTLKDYEKYWQDIESINVHFLKEGLYTQEEFDAIQQDNKIKQLEGTLEVLKSINAQTVESQEEVNKKILETEKELNDEIIADNKRKNEKTTEDNRKAAEDKEKIEKALYEATNSLVTGFIDMAAQSRRQAADAEIEALQEQLDKQLENEFITEQQREALQEQFNERRRQILNEQAQRDKQAKIAQAVIDGIVAVIAAKGVAEKIAVGILNAAQLALLIAAPLPQYKEGDVDIQGPGTDTSDSILARISRGESVINARSTRKHKDILKVINRGNDEELMKLIKVKYYPADEKPEKKQGFADNLVNQIKLQSKFDDSNIVKQLKGIRPATAKDIEELGNTITKGNREAALLNKLK